MSSLQEAMRAHRDSMNPGLPGPPQPKPQSVADIARMLGGGEEVAAGLAAMADEAAGLNPPAEALSPAAALEVLDLLEEVGAGTVAKRQAARAARQAEITPPKG